MRLFVGISLSAAVAGELASIVARLKRKDDGLRWTAPESWHITLQFLGEIGTEECDCVAARLRDVHAPAVPLALEGLGCFERAGVFHAGVRLSPELKLLQGRVTSATAPCGFTAEMRAFQPHITLARSKGERQGLLELKKKIGRQPQFVRFTATEFLLYESFLSPVGARYEVRDRFGLSA